MFLATDSSASVCARWLTDEGQSGLDKSWIPFGGGARKCMGYNFAILEIKVSKTLSAVAAAATAAAAGAAAAALAAAAAAAASV